MILHTYFRSSAAYRVRIALNLKGLAAEQCPVHLRHGEQATAAFRAINPQGLVPVLRHGGTVIPQSLAIIEYLEDTHPRPPLLPVRPEERARVRAMAQLVACDIHPLNNLRVLTYLTDTLKLDDTHRVAWINHWIAEGFAALETMRAGSRSRFCHGETPTIADICLVPQMVNAQRFACDLTPYPTLQRIFETCMALPAFADAHPDRQPDAETPL